MALNEVGNPYKCPCCFPCDEIPLCTSAFPDCPSAYYCGPTRRENDPGWATPTYTPKCKSSWGVSGADCVYWSPEVGNAECNCTGVWAQYCIDYPSGYKGRAWVVEFFCIDGATQVVSAATYIAPDWQCACGDIAGQLAGSGPRFAFFITPSGCCCSCGGVPDCTCTPPPTLYMDITGCACWEVTAEPLTYNSGTGCWEAASDPATCIVAAGLCCVDGLWTLTLTQNNAECSNPVVTAASGSCDPFSLTFSAALDSSCCPPSGGSLTVTVME